ncbi:hypothetical protein BAUCODRAFT_146182 [Baudoinia panamericana UAMH 10762]|uniref:PNPLA domain-containing protein n=1 Tax=Baudoinia panamericana (strain UAMH 10762) TaxID=717646 RepID=M2NII7_BAUPA|nr:uncharacterized protein BAUCODRAFT_146182 [Baudoinia panamericana UAMH 10762]EMC99209.1 hypothetical protein BAUCODRAFT_146182 [Baudoinia panamericana UAMH 10762]
MASSYSLPDFEFHEFSISPLANPLSSKEATSCNEDGGGQRFVHARGGRSAQSEEWAQHRTFEPGSDALTRDGPQYDEDGTDRYGRDMPSESTSGSGQLHGHQMDRVGKVGHRAAGLTWQGATGASESHQSHSAMSQESGEGVGVALHEKFRDGSGNEEDWEGSNVRIISTAQHGDPRSQPSNFQPTADHFGGHSGMAEPTHFGIPGFGVSSRATIFPGPHGADAPERSIPTQDDEDEVIKQAMELSKYTAAQEEMQRAAYAAQQQSIVRKPPIARYPLATADTAHTAPAIVQCPPNDILPEYSEVPKHSANHDHTSITTRTTEDGRFLHEQEARNTAAVGYMQNGAHGFHVVGRSNGPAAQNQRTTVAPSSTHNRSTDRADTSDSVAFDTCPPSAEDPPPRNPVRPRTNIVPHAPKSANSSVASTAAVRYSSQRPSTSATTFLDPQDDRVERATTVGSSPSLQTAENRVSRSSLNAYNPVRIPISSSPPPSERGSSSPQMLQYPDNQRARPQFVIRESSRTRNRTQSISSAGGSGELCENCRTIGPHRWYCNVCGIVYCGICWDKPLFHQENHLAIGSIPHERTLRNIAMKVANVLTPKLTDAAREQLHLADIDTTWFGVVREGHERPLFRDYGRYANLMASARDLRLESAEATSATTAELNRDILYPSLVSFVGETGAGKSTLIKLLIDLHSEEHETFATPVVGAPGHDISTSEDVHLYLDPHTSESQAPILFADCEGLEGGERDPTGARLKKEAERRHNAALAAGNRRRPRLKHTSERELLWADSPHTQSRTFAVAHLYPRLLYTFSDVIVFVLKNHRAIERVLERLVDWAQAALEKSSNQPVLPHAIIALNACENDIPVELWDVDTATSRLLADMSRTVHQNATFKKHAEFWRVRDRQIDSVQDLLHAYYRSVRVVRIPTNGRPKLIDEQVMKFSEGIQQASNEARDKKAELRMLFDADEFQPYLQEAFDHFAKDLNTPFDFVQASLKNSPIPSDFGGNILKLALQIMHRWKNLAKGDTIFEEMSYVVASCIMLDAARTGKLGNPLEIFPNYLEHLDNALENFCLHHWPCEYISNKAGRCGNVRSGHDAKGHQLSSGKLLAAGAYQSKFFFEGYQHSFRDNTFHLLVALQRRVRALEQDGMSEEMAAAEVHKNHVLPLFLEHASRAEPREFVSHTVCFCCLFDPPEHALPCGHIICTRCLTLYGHVHSKRFVEIHECPMERRARRFRNVWQIELFPPSCGVRILTLDGGGVRGIVELEILRHLFQELGCINIQNFFDLIVGTSTGGLIALGLTSRNWTVEECIEQFTTFCKQAFTLRRGIGVPVIGQLVSHYNHSRYETQPLEDALKTAFTHEQYLFGGRRADPGSTSTKVAVTATAAAGQSVVLSNYNRLCTRKLPYHFQRPDNLDTELKTWEAARATSAAPTYFKPLCHEPSKMVYSDGGVYHNNPIVIADYERKLIWPHQQDVEPDIIVSIGTLYSDKTKDKRALSQKWTSSPRGVVSHGKFLQKMATDHLHTSLDSERAWNMWLNARDPTGADKARYVRLNPKLEDHPPKLDEVSELRHLQELTWRCIKDDRQYGLLALRLVATCFYFDVSGDVREDYVKDVFEVSGYLQCRLRTGVEIEELGRFIKRKATAGHDAHFLIQEEGNETTIPVEVRLDSKIIDRMIDRRTFRLDQRVDIRQSNKSSRTQISLCYTRDTSYPISGFPRQLHSSKAYFATSRHGLSYTSSFRWVARSDSQHQRRFDWKPQTLAAPINAEDLIERYADATHLLGNAMQSDLMDGKGGKGCEYPGALLSPYAFAAHSVGSHVQPVVAELAATPVVQQYHELPTFSERVTDRSLYFEAKDDWVAFGKEYLDLMKGDLVKVSEKLETGKYFNDG